jgi:hypothetical protein
MKKKERMKKVGNRRKRKGKNRCKRNENILATKTELFMDGKKL